MRHDPYSFGGATVGVLNRMEAWEANLVLNLRLWCDGPAGQAQVKAEYQRALSNPEAQREYEAFETLLLTVIVQAYRPLVRHSVDCACVGSDECVFLNLVRTASEGHLNDAALIATLLIGPAMAEKVALLAGHVGEFERRRHTGPPEGAPPIAPNVVRLH